MYAIRSYYGLIIQRRIHKTFLEKLIAACKTIKLGDPADSDTMIGPMVSETQMNKALDYIEIGKREGAELVYGGYRIEDGELAKGYYVCPTIFDEVSSVITSYSIHYTKLYEITFLVNFFLLSNI